MKPWAWIPVASLLLAAACSTGDPAGEEGGPGAQDSTGQQEIAAPEVGEDTPVPEGPSCYEALTCLVNLKNWVGGPVMPGESDCLEGISGEEMEDVDGVLTCVEAKCSAEFADFEDGGDLELGVLYLCLIERCAAPTSVCIGGQGEDDCGDALWCLAGCDPFAQSCTTSCIAETSQAQAEKTGGFLQCVLDACPLAEVGTTCPVPMACGLKCPEAI